MSYKGKSVLAIIPARGGSEGIPLKNLAKVGDKSLLYLAGKTARDCSLVDWMAVSTDHPDIKKEAWGFGTIIDRPPELSTGRVGDVAVLNHAVEFISSDSAIYPRAPQKIYDIILMLQPTSPFRRPEHLKAAIEKLVDGGYDSVWSVSPIRDHPFKALQIKDDKLDDYFSNVSHYTHRQQYPSVCRRNGVVYAMTRECLLERKALMTENTGYILNDDFQISIDTEEDLILANLMHKYMENQ